MANTATTACQRPTGVLQHSWFHEGVLSIINDIHMYLEGASAMVTGNPVVEYGHRQPSSRT